MSGPALSAPGEVTVRNGPVCAQLIAAAAGLTLRVQWNGAEVLPVIRLGPVVDGADLGSECVITSAITTARREPYVMRTGKAVGSHVARHEESAVTLRHLPSGRCWELTLRAAPDGVAFRYRMPDGEMTVGAGPEATRIWVSGGARGWFLDYQTWYETPRFGAQVRDLTAGRALGLPALLRLTGGCHVLICESAIDGRCSGAHLVAQEQSAEGDGAFAVRTADALTTMSGGGVTPWRVLIIGDLATVTTSRLVDELAPAAEPGLATAGWIRPGRAAWSWWSDFGSPGSLTHQQRFADYAAQQGWEHLLVDAGWDEAWLPELVSYASQRGLAVHVWSHWTALTGLQALGKLALWRSWGVAGVKIDFMESEAQERYLWYDTVIAETARLGLMVNFHGSVIPRGWARTYPHVMSYEGIRGAEYYRINLGDPPTAAHNVAQPFTRNVAGSMDYTPVTFSAPQRETSEAHELALSVAFESGITHFADDVAEYAGRPLAHSFLAEVAPCWHETRLLGGTPDTEAVVARRHDDRWFIGCICAGPARTIEVDVSALPGLAEFDAWLITDTGDRAGLTGTAVTGCTTGKISVPVAANGGFAGIMVPAGAPLRRAVPRPRVRPPDISPSATGCAPGGTVTFSVSPGASLRVPPGWTARESGNGTWQVTVPPDAVAGGAVVTAELAGPDGAPVFAHVRLQVQVSERS